jgi:hypothetical protein
MFNKLTKTLITNENTMYLGNKRVEIPKLTPKKWRQLFETVDLLPGLIMQVILAPKDNFYSYIIAVCNEAMTEIKAIVSILSGVDEKYLEEHVGLDEILSFLTRTIKRNNIEDVVKNVKSLLPIVKR